MNIPQDLLYTKDHEWVRLASGIATVGITDFAQGELGDVVFIELPQLNVSVAQGQLLGSIEAVKTVAEIFSPISGVVTEVNVALTDKPELINKDPYGEGWIARIKADDLATHKPNLLDPAAYADLTSV